MPAALIPGLVQAGAGLVQSFIGGGKAGRAQRQLEKMINNYQPNQSIIDFYNKALSKYNLNPYNSASYRMQQQNSQRNLSTGLNYLGDRRSAVAGVGSLVQGANDAELKAVANAEQMGAQNLAQLGQATGMKAAEDKYKFEAKANLLGMKAGGGNQIMNAGLSNLYGGISNISDYYTAKEIYGSGNKK